MQPELCFVGGKLIEKVTEADLGQGHMDWRREIGTPRQWHEDNLPLKHLEIFPKSNFDGAAIVGDVPPIGKYGGFFPTERNLTMVGPAAPSKKSWALADTLDGIPDSFSHYLLFGILEQVFGGESELRDVQRAAYCHARFEEGVQVSIMLASEELLEKDN
jgi:hypothetical protein